MGTLRQDLRGPFGYVFGVAVFLLALGVTLSTVWFRTHFPSMAYFMAGVATCYVAGLGPAAFVAGLSSVAMYLTYEPTRFFPPKDSNPVLSGAVLFVVMLTCSAGLAALMRSRDRLEVERERYARLAESRDLLYREMQHRVSNNIQIVAGLLRLQSQGLQDAAAKRALTEASSRISLIARIQRQLHDQSGQPAPFRRFAEELLTDALHAEQATPVSLVLLECVNNALEHAYAPGQEGLVRAVLTREGAHHVLTVSDNGRGLPEDFDLDAGKSLGLKIVRTMASQLNGDFHIKPQHPGALCTLYFPDLG